MSHFSTARRRRHDAGREVMFDLVKNPRRAHGGAADHRSGDVRFGAPLSDIVRVDNVAIADHRNRNRTRDFTDCFPIGSAGISLRARSSVDRNRSNA